MFPCDGVADANFHTQQLWKILVTLVTVLLEYLFACSNRVCPLDL